MRGESLLVLQRSTSTLQQPQKCMQLVIVMLLQSAVNCVEKLRLQYSSYCNVVTEREENCDKY